MINTIGEDHHREGKYPPGDGNCQLCPAIVGRDGDEQAHSLPEPDHNSHVEQAKDADNVAMGSFNGPFGAVVHAAHAAFAAVRPERPVVDGKNGFHRAVINTKVAFVAGVVREKRFGQNKPPYEKISDAHR